MFRSVPPARLNRIASFVVLPMMTLAIVVFSRFAQSDESKAPPPESGTLVVANLREQSLAFIDVATGARRDLGLPGPPHEMVEAAGRLYVTLGRRNAVAEIEPAGPAILRLLPLEGEPHGLAAWGDNLVVTLDKGRAAVVIDRASLTELRRYYTGDTPHVVAVSSQALLVTDSRENQLRLLEPSVGTVATGALPEGIVLAGGLVATTNAGDGTMTVARATDLAGATNVAVGAGPVRATAVGGTKVLVALQAANELVLLDLQQLRVEKRIPVGERPDGVCGDAAGAYFAVAGNGDGSVEVVASEDWKIAASLQLEAGLGSCLWLGER